MYHSYPTKHPIRFPLPCMKIHNIPTSYHRARPGDHPSPFEKPSHFPGEARPRQRRYAIAACIAWNKYTRTARAPQALWGGAGPHFDRGNDHKRQRDKGYNTFNGEVGEMAGTFCAVA